MRLPAAVPSDRMGNLSPTFGVIFVLNSKDELKFLLWLIAEKNYACCKKKCFK